VKHFLIFGTSIDTEAGRCRADEWMSGGDGDDEHLLVFEASPTERALAAEIAGRSKLDMATELLLLRREVSWLHRVVRDLDLRLSDVEVGESGGRRGASITGGGGVGTNRATRADDPAEYEFGDASRNEPPAWGGGEEDEEEKRIATDYYYGDPATDDFPPPLPPSPSHTLRAHGANAAPMGLQLALTGPRMGPGQAVGKSPRSRTAPAAPTTPSACGTSSSDRGSTICSYSTASSPPSSSSTEIQRPASTSVGGNGSAGGGGRSTCGVNGVAVMGTDDGHFLTRAQATPSPRAGWWEHRQQTPAALPSAVAKSDWDA
jgi:hypothetical protein